MLTVEARVETERPSRYLVQMCRHVDQMTQHLGHRPSAHRGGDAPPKIEHVEWSDTNGIVRLNCGQWTMRATADGLTLRAEADDEESLRRIQELVSGRLERIGRRDHLTVEWQPPQEVPDQPGQATGTAAPLTRHAGQGHGRIIGLMAIGVLATAVHLGLGGAVLVHLRWTGRIADSVLAVVLVLIVVKVAVLGRLAIRRGRTKAR